MKTFKVAIIGGGPGGYVTAIRLNQYGIDTILFEKERIGGVCLNKGCIPTKTLVKISDFYSSLKNADKFGVNVKDFTYNFKNILQRKNEVVEKLVSGVEYIFKKRKIPVIKDVVKEIEKVDDKYIIKSDEIDVKTDFVILATGSKPKELPTVKIDHKYILSSTDILNIEELPQELVIIGGGVIGCEFATIFAEFGVKVQIVEFFPNLIFNEDTEISKRLAVSLKKAGVKLHLNTYVTNWEEKSGKVLLKLSNGKEIETQKVLLSVGREPFFDIKLKNFDINFEKKFIKINDNMMTSEENIFAIGDITGKLMLAHTASKQGLIVADILNYKINNIKSSFLPIDYNNIPRCIFTKPEIASVGITEKKAKEQFGEMEIGKFPFSANGKALAMDETFGFVKIVADKKNKKILGVHIIGPNATELIAAATPLINEDLKKIKDMVYAHPTLSEAIGESIEDLEKLAIHKM